MTSHVIAYRSTELLFSTHTFDFNCFFDDFNCVFTQIRCLSRLLSSFTFSKTSFRNTIRVSNGFDPDQDRCYVSANLGLNCLQRLSEDDKKQEELTLKSYSIITPLKYQVFENIMENGAFALLEQMLHFP